MLCCLNTQFRLLCECKYRDSDMWCNSRYLFVDHMLTAVQASPQNKVATLSSESLQLMANARAEMKGLINSSQVC